MRPSYNLILNAAQGGRPVVAFCMMIGSVLLICRGVAAIGMPLFFASVWMLKG